MKKRTSISLMALVCCAAMQAQTRTVEMQSAQTDSIRSERIKRTNEIVYKIMDPFYIECTASVTPRQHDMVPMKFDLVFGYEPIKRTTVMFSLSKLLGLSNVNGDKSYSTSNAIGGGLGYRIFTQTLGALRGEALDVRGMVSTSTSSSDMRFTSFDVGFHYYRKTGGLFYPTIGVGFRHINFHRHELSDVDNIYISAGLRF